MCEDQFCSVLDRRELPGDAGPFPMRGRALPGNPVYFLVPDQFGHLKMKDTRRRPKTKFTKRTHLWFDSRLVGPPLNDFVLLSQGVVDAPWGCGNGEFFDNS